MRDTTKELELEQLPGISELTVFDRFKNAKVGAIPLPTYLVMSAIIIASAYLGELPVNMLGGFAVILSLGWLLGGIGASIPGLKNFGGSAILSLMVPSIMVFMNVFNQNTLDAANMLMREANFLYFCIACLVCGSILGMHRKILVQGLIRMIIPMDVAMISALIVGTSVGTLLGLGFEHTLFYIVTPIIAGGIGEGILPLSLGYSAITGIPSGELAGQLIPATIIGNFFAIICSGILNRLGEKYPEKSGKGQLIKFGGDADMADAMKEDKSPLDIKLMGAGVLTACTLFIAGGLLERLTGFPGPVLMILIAATIKYLSLLPKDVEKGSKQLYKFVSGNFTFPLMVGLTVVVTGFFVGGKMNMNPIEAAIVTACQSGMGGTGDVAILSASNRMNLMPFAQVATRLGGAITVISMTSLLRFLF